MDLIDFDQLAAEPERVAYELCQINLQNLGTTVAQHPGLFAFVVASYEMAKVEEARAKNAVSKAMAEYFLRSQAMPVTRAQSLVDSDPTVIAAKEAYIEAQAKVAPLRALVSGLEHRRDMILQISARQRAEYVATPK